ncbi:MAG: ComEC/Rec2 family competence protein [Bacteroidia bacterium]
MQQATDFSWRQLPFFRLLLFLLVGYALGSRMAISPLFAMVLACSLLLSSWLLSKSAWQGRYQYRHLHALLLYAAITSCGMARQALSQQQNGYTSYADLQSYNYILVKLSNYPAWRAKHFRIEAKLLAGIGAEPKPLQAGLMLYADSTAVDWKAGDFLLIPRNQIIEIAENSNPHAFSWKQHQAKKGLHYQAYLRNGHVQWQAAEPKFGLRTFALGIRQQAIGQLYRFMPRAQDAAFAAALLLGERSGLDQELVRAYSASGVIHILAVSGLHVGILFLIFSWFFKTALRLPSTYALPLILVCLWLYALVTALPPSVSRACSMFSLLAIARELKRDALVYNTMAASAFLLLWFRPGLLAETGFQLSFGAVLGIIYLQPKIYRLIYVRHRWLDWCWQLSSVSLAAQLFTMPLGIYYFHQFPNYFLPANLLVIPLTAPLLIGSLLLVITAPLAPLASLIAWLLAKLFWVLNAGVQFIEALPGALSEGLLWHEMQVVLFYLILLSLVWWLQGHSAWRSRAIWLAVLWCCFPLWRLAQRQKTEHLVVYDNRKQATAAFLSKTTGWGWGSHPDVDFSPMQQHFIWLGTKAFEQVNINPLSLWQWHGLRILHLSENPTTDSLPTADLLLISHQALPKRQWQLLRNYQMILLDSSNSPYYCKQIAEQAKQSGSSCRAVPLEGAISLTPWTINTYKAASTKGLAASF